MDSVWIWHYLGQVDVGNDNLVQGRRGILLGSVGVTTRVILVHGFRLGLPGLAVGNLGDLLFRAWAGGCSSWRAVVVNHLV